MIASNLFTHGYIVCKDWKKGLKIEIKTIFCFFMQFFPVRLKGVAEGEIKQLFCKLLFLNKTLGAEGTDLITIDLSLGVKYLVLTLSLNGTDLGLDLILNNAGLDYISDFWYIYFNRK